MTDHPDLHRPDTRQRRALLQAAAALAVLPLAGLARSAGWAATIAAMQRGREVETTVYYHYNAYSRQALQEGYRGVAYLFTAIAASEQIHASNFGKVLTRLGVELAPLARPAIKAGTTRDNLLRAVEGELHSIDAFYPRMLEQLKAEGHEDAMTMVRWAWSAEQQHRDKMTQIQRWAPAFFEKVARTIDEKTGRYHVCQICGSTVNTVPADVCPVCQYPASHYRGIEAPA
jgi:rubrerythrin